MQTYYAYNSAHSYAQPNLSLFWKDINKKINFQWEMQVPNVCISVDIDDVIGYHLNYVLLLSSTF